MAVKTRVVAHFLDGKLIKGVIQDFNPNHPTFHLFPLGGAAGVQVRVSQLKAAFFVRDFEGDPVRSDLRGFIAGPEETVHGRKLAVRFSDGELLCGYTLAYSLRREGFFMYPADPGSNNQRIFVVLSEDTEIQEGRSAEELAQRVLDSRAA